MKQTFSVRHLGNLLRTPAAAGSVILGLAFGPVLMQAQPAWAQLPPVNMGKFVHQPGDNQYSNATQNDRHQTGPSYQVVNPSAQQMQGPSGWTPVHKNRPDISIEPIVCDEPIPKAGFPPVPDALELPGIRGGGSFSAPGALVGGAGGGPGGGGWGAQSAPGMGMPAPTNHQGYGTYQPGYFAQGKTTGKGAEMYHKPGGEVYSSGDGAAKPGGASAPAPQTSSTQTQLNRMGKEPTLSAKADTNAAPEAPQAVQINQSTTQDLSLPDDQSNGGKKKKSQAGRAAQRAARRVTSRMGGMMNSFIRMPGH